MTHVNNQRYCNNRERPVLSSPDSPAGIDSLSGYQALSIRTVKNFFCCGILAEI